MPFGLDKGVKIKEVKPGNLVQNSRTKPPMNHALDEQEFRDLLRACAALPLPDDVYADNDFVTDLLETVLNFQMLRTTVTKALNHFESNCRDKIQNFTDLEDLLKFNKDDLSVAIYLWGYRYWNRVTLLRRLVAFFRSEGIADKDRLKRWAGESTFQRDFEGRVPGLGFAVYKWLVMRQGIQTIKPDTHVRAFVFSVTGIELDDPSLVNALAKVAARLNMQPQDLDWRIWEHQRKQKSLG
jgi:hypothetical protein